MMDSSKQFNILDLIITLLKWKKFLLAFLVPAMVITYLLIFFLIDEKYDSKAVIIPSEDNSITSLAGMFDNLGGLPFDIGGSSPEMSMYTTIIYSRTMLQRVIDDFSLIEEYKISTNLVDYKELALKELSDNIRAEENEQMAYEIEVRSPKANLSSDIVNYIIEKLNQKLLDLKIKKSKENKEFLFGRLVEVRESLRNAEDSLLFFQKQSGLLSLEDQVTEIMKAYSNLETELVAKQVQLQVLSKIYGENSPKLKNTEIELNEYEKSLSELRDSGSDNGLLLALENLPQNALRYYRLVREIEINNMILKFLMPLYEQAKLEEQKNIPLIQVIDFGVPAAKKSYPPRSIFTLLITFGVFSLLTIYILIKENPNSSNSSKYKELKNNILKW